MNDVSRCIKDLFGITIRDEKSPVLISKLKKRLQVDDEIEVLSVLRRAESDRTGEAYNRIAAAVTTNHTTFFREPHHFDILSKFADEFKREFPEEKEFLSWSAACSTGLEAYSIALQLENSLPSNINYKILATDVSRDVLQKAKKGTFEVQSVDNLTHLKIDRYTIAESRGKRILKGDLMDKIYFAQMNLVEHWPMSKRFHSIFCRNVAIYFDSEVQQTLWGRLIAQLHPGGLLFIGHSERIFGHNMEFVEPVGTTAYRKLGFS